LEEPPGEVVEVPPGLNRHDGRTGLLARVECVRVPLVQLSALPLGLGLFGAPDRIVHDPEVEAASRERTADACGPQAASGRGEPFPDGRCVRGELAPALAEEVAGVAAESVRQLTRVARQA